MSQPDFVPLHTGDVHDDDGQVIDNLVNDWTGPPPEDYKARIEVVELVEPTVCTRLITNTLTVRVGWAPTLLLPEDANRVELIIHAYSAAGSPSSVTDYVLVTTQPGQPSGFLRHGEKLCLDSHTGAVWVAPNATSDVVLSYWSVTK